MNYILELTGLRAFYMSMLLSDCIEDMKKEYEVSCGWPITDDSQSLQRFCSKLEHLLQVGLRGTTVPNAIIFVVRGCV